MPDEEPEWKTLLRDCTPEALANQCRTNMHAAYLELTGQELTGMEKSEKPNEWLHFDGGMIRKDRIGHVNFKVLARGKREPRYIIEICPVTGDKLIAMDVGEDGAGEFTIEADRIRAEVDPNHHRDPILAELADA